MHHPNAADWQRPYQKKMRKFSPSYIEEEYSHFDSQFFSFRLNESLICGHHRQAAIHLATRYGVVDHTINPIDSFFWHLIDS